MPVFAKYPTQEDHRLDAIELIQKEIIEKKLTPEEWNKLFTSKDGKIDYDGCPEIVIRIRPNQVRCYVEKQLPLQPIPAFLPE